MNVALAIHHHRGGVHNISGLTALNDCSDSILRCVCVNKDFLIFYWFFVLSVRIFVLVEPFALDRP